MPKSEAWKQYQKDLLDERTKIMLENVSDVIYIIRETAKLQKRLLYEITTPNPDLVADVMNMTVNSPVNMLLIIDREETLKETIAEKYGQIADTPEEAREYAEGFSIPAMAEVDLNEDFEKLDITEEMPDEVKPYGKMGEDVRIYRKRPDKLNEHRKSGKKTYLIFANKDLTYKGKKYKKGQIIDQTNIKRSMAADRATRAWTTVPRGKGQGMFGDLEGFDQFAEKTGVIAEMKRKGAETIDELKEKMGGELSDEQQAKRLRAIKSLNKSIRSALGKEIEEVDSMYPVPETDDYEVWAKQALYMQNKLQALKSDRKLNL